MDKKKNFLDVIVQNDLDTKKYNKIVTRFPPEPNGFPHIGHAKSIVVNFGLAKKYQGHCNLRMDDTNPTKEDTKYVEALKDAVKWLGYDYGSTVYHTSDYFDKLYGYAIQLIKMGKAYVDSVDESTMKEYRGTVTTAGKRSKYASRSVEENLNLLEDMKNGKFKDGEHILRAKIDMSSPNMKMRDPLLYRIRNVEHFRTKDKWHIYPMYDFAHCLSDYIEGISHSICTLEFENNRELYDWILDTLELEPPRPYQYEFARLNMNYTVMSKRKLLELVQGGFVIGWDDPRLPTIAGYKRKGYTPQSIINFCEQIGVAKANSVVDVSQLEFCIRDDLNQKVPRVMCVLNPLKVTIVNYDDKEEIEASYYPADVAKTGSRKLPFSKHIYIDAEDFDENPPKGYYRLTPNQPVRLKHAYIISCEEIIKDKDGKVIEIKAKYYKDSKSGNDTSGIKVKSAIQWVDATHNYKVELRLYDRLFNCEAPQGVEDLNPNSLKIIKNALIEPSVIENPIDERFQFERVGYFYADPIDYTKENPVFNKIVGLKDSWGKKTNRSSSNNRRRDKKKETKPQQNKNISVALTPQEQERFDRFTKDLKLNSEISNILAKDEFLSSFFNDTLKLYDSAITIANIVTNEIAKYIKDNTLQQFKISSQDIATLAKLIDDETISSKIAKQVFNDMVSSSKDPQTIIKEQGLEQISNPDEILPLIDKVIEQNPQNVQKYKNGNQKLFGFFVGQVLKATNGKGNPKVVNELVKKRLSE